MDRVCFLKCITDSHAPIKLPHREEVIVGRSKITTIKDQSCSRQQLSLKSDCDSCIVEVKLLGLNPSGVDGFALAKHRVYKLEHGSKIEILINSYTHIIEFDPPPPDSSSQTEKIGSKRKLEDDKPSPKIKRHRKMETPEKPTHLLEATWESIDNGEVYIYTTKGVRASSKIAAFDMDGTLIKTKSGKVYPVDIHDWQIAFNPVCDKLKELISKEFKIVIFSNQAPIGNGRVKIEDFKKKIEGLAQKLAVPVHVFLATGKGIYRKPSIGMWKLLSEQKNCGVEIDINESFYCGDAAGRVANWAPGKRKDHSMADKLMAENLGIKFYTPEHFFLDQTINKACMSKPEFIPSALKPEVFNNRLISQKQEILVLVGYPGSGKSFLAKEIEERSNNKYMTVCRDILGTWQKCAAKAKEYLQQGKSVIVDCTNPHTESRERWTALAKTMKVDCRCAKMDVSMAHARHNNKFRELMKFNHMPVNDIVYHTYKNKYVEPSESEGFSEVVEVKFFPTFANKEEENLYRMFLLEK